MSNSPRRNNRASQRDRILRLLQDAAGAWVPLQRILELNIAQYNSRVFERRRLGYVIENKQESNRSRFRLLSATLATHHEASEGPRESPSISEFNTPLLFSLPERPWRDPEER